MINEENADKFKEGDLLEVAVCYEKDLKQEWNEINWNKCMKHVYKLQEDVFHNIKVSDNYRTARNLERHLLNGNSLKLYSIRAVTKNYMKIKGRDETLEMNDAIRMALFYRLTGIKINDRNLTYVKESFYKKGKRNMSPINIETLLDMIVQMMVKLSLEPRFEAIFEPTSYGYRPLRNKGHALAEIRQNTQFYNRKWAFVTNFESSLKSLDYNWLIDKLGNFHAKRMISLWLKHDYLKNNGLNEDKPSPRDIITPILTNIALDGLDEALEVSYKKNKEGNYSNFTRYQMIRYKEDVVILCRNKKDAENIPNVLEDYLEERNIKLDEEKTSIVPISDGFDFLGFTVREFKSHNKGKVVIRPSKDSLKEFRANAKEIFFDNKGNNVVNLIKRLNRLISKTANYWKDTEARKSFENMDYYIWMRTERFLKRSHPTKGWKWIKNRYLKEDHTGMHNNKSLLTSPDNPKLQLRKMSWTSLKPAILLKHDCNPYNRDCTDYIQEICGCTGFEYLYMNKKN